MKSKYSWNTGAKRILIILLFLSKGARNLNPIPYHAEYMGHKLHMDQNEKLGMFGVTHVVAVDGNSSKIVANATMPVKNNLFIYEQVYRWVLHYLQSKLVIMFCMAPHIKLKVWFQVYFSVMHLTHWTLCMCLISTRCAVVANGMWDQVRVDHGKEFYLCLYIQEILSRHRYNLSRQPYLQTTSSRVRLCITTKKGEERWDQIIWPQWKLTEFVSNGIWSIWICQHLSTAWNKIFSSYY